MTEDRKKTLTNLMRALFIPAAVAVCALEYFAVGGSTERLLYAALAVLILSPAALEIWAVILVLRFASMPYLPDSAVDYLAGTQFEFARITYLWIMLLSGRLFASHALARSLARVISMAPYLTSALLSLTAVVLAAIALFWPVAHPYLLGYVAALLAFLIFKLPKAEVSTPEMRPSGEPPKLTTICYVGLFLLSVATLLLEVLHTRILSFMLFPSLVYIVVSFAMLGFGVSGAALSVHPPSQWLKPSNRLALLAMAFAVTAVLGILALARFPISAFSFMHYPGNLVLLVIYYLVFTTPYYFSGQCLGALFTLHPKRISKLYFVNLLGSGLGCLLLVLLLSPLGGQGTLFVAAILGLASAMAFAVGHSARILSAAGGLALAFAILTITSTDQFLVFKVDPDKELGRVLYPHGDLPGTLEYTGWSPISRTDIATARWMEKDNVTVHLLGKQWSTKMVAADGGAYTPMIKAVPAEMMQEARDNIYVMKGFRMLGYLTVDHPDTLIIGCGGGSDVIAAKLRDPKKITAVDLNPVTIYAMKHVFQDFNGNLYNDPEIDVYAAEGRSFVSRTDQKFTNIHMNGVDTLNALAAGANVTAENYLYTTEAMVDYLNHLEDNGFLTIARLSFDIPRETIKLCTAMFEAFDRLNLGNASEHIMIIGDKWSQWTTFVCKKTPLTPADMEVYEDAFDTGLFRVFYTPRMTPQEEYPEGCERARYFLSLFQAYEDGLLDRYIASYPYDIRPATDDRPYFFKVHKADSFLNPLKTVTPYERNFGLIALIILLVQTILVSLVLIIFPLVRMYRDGLRVKHRTKYLTYFSGLGLAFMLIELSLMQKLSLMMGHPTYSIAIVLTSILIFCGIGSLLSGVIRLSPRQVLMLAIGGITVIVLLYIPLLPRVTQATLAWPLFLRSLIAMALLAPLAFCMGMPFPTGLRLLSEVHTRFIPWAWGANGVASVLGTVLCILLSMSYGFNIVLMLAVGVYIIALICMLAARPAPATIVAPAQPD